MSMRKLIEGVALPRKDFTVAVINYPGFHPTPLMESWFGFKWSEWDLVRKCRPRFKGHQQPMECAWGEFDESDPAWAVGETDAAADHGIDAWIYDWYWYSGVEIWNEGLNRGFLRAPNRKRMKFGVMWANHSWQNCFPAPQTGALPMMLPIRHSMEDFDRVMDYWCERYFSQANYWRIEGKPWCSIFSLWSLLEQFGGEKAAGRGVERLRKRAEKNGEKGIYLGAFASNAMQAKWAKSLGFDHATTYNITTGAKQTAGQATVDYRDVMANHVQQWRILEELGVPYWPVVTQGWDVSARNHPYEPWPPVRWEWPWGHIVTGNTPERFGELVYAARQFMATQKQDERVMVINAWNEWTEGSVLLPTKRDGWGTLNALKKALNQK